MQRQWKRCPDNKSPKVIYSDKPAEMIVFEGEPKLEPVEGTDLEWASNTDSDVFFLKSTSTWYSRETKVACSVLGAQLSIQQTRTIKK